jgi:16S rRNA (cytosine967-C5)-methyltransferase
VTAPARTAALHALRAIAAGHTDLPSALASTRQRLTDPRDRALAAEIVSGTLRWQRSVDCLIESFSNRPLPALDPDVLHILRLSLYQLLHLDRVPAAAVVDDAVDLTRHARRRSATGFVNAVLRETLRRRGSLPLPPRPADEADRAGALAYLGVTHSHPEWLVARWLDRCGFDATERWVRFNNEIPRLTLRANTLRARRADVAGALARSGIETEPAPYAPDGLMPPTCGRAASVCSMRR